MMGAIEILYETLSEDIGLTALNVNLYLGEEHIWTNAALPKVVMVPRSGNYAQNIQPGYAQVSADTSASVGVTLGFPIGTDGNPLTDKVPLAGIQELIEFHIYAAATGSNLKPGAHYSAIEAVRAALLQAFKAQKQTGLYYVAATEQWIYSTAQNKYGRALVVTARFDITVPAATGGIAIIKTETLKVSNG